MKIIVFLHLIFFSYFGNAALISSYPDFKTESLKYEVLNDNNFAAQTTINAYIKNNKNFSINVENSEFGKLTTSGIANCSDLKILYSAAICGFSLKITTPKVMGLSEKKTIIIDGKEYVFEVSLTDTLISIAKENVGVSQPNNLQWLDSRQETTIIDDLNYSKDGNIEAKSGLKYKITIKAAQPISFYNSITIPDNLPLNKKVADKTTADYQDQLYSYSIDSSTCSGNECNLIFNIHPFGSLRRNRTISYPLIIPATYDITGKEITKEKTIANFFVNIKNPYEGLKYNVTYAPDPKINNLFFYKTTEYSVKNNSVKIEFENTNSFGVTLHKNISLYADFLKVSSNENPCLSNTSLKPGMKCSVTLKLCSSVENTNCKLPSNLIGDKLFALKVLSYWSPSLDPIDYGIPISLKVECGALAQYNYATMKCESGTVPCLADHAVLAEKKFDKTTGLWGECIAKSCEQNYSIINGRCVNNFISCNDNIGIGFKYLDQTTGLYGVCKYKSCNDPRYTTNTAQECVKYCFYHIENGICQTTDSRSIFNENIIPNGLSNSFWDYNKNDWSIPVSNTFPGCRSGFMPNNDYTACIPGIKRDCTPISSSKEIYSDFWLLGTNQRWSGCQFDHCLDPDDINIGFSGNPKCIPNKIVEPVSGGTATKYYDISSGTYVCTQLSLINCNPGFKPIESADFSFRCIKEECLNTTKLSSQECEDHIPLTNRPMYVLNKISNIEYPLAKCYDGTPASYYLRKGVESGANRWIIHLQGGGFCGGIPNDNNQKADSCLIKDDYLLSSSYNQITLSEASMPNILSNNEYMNPGFYSWNHVYVNYCSQDFWTGRSEKHHGYDILNAVISDLKLKYNLNNSKQIIFMGHSAGGAAIHFYGDFIKTHWLKDIDAELTLINDGGFINEYENSTNMNMEKIIKYNQLNTWNSLESSSLSNAEQDSFNGELIANKSSKKINNRYYILQDQLDYELLYYNHDSLNYPLANELFLNTKTNILEPWVGKFVASHHPCLYGRVPNLNAVSFFENYLANYKLDSSYNYIMPISGQHTFTSPDFPDWNTPNYLIDGKSIQEIFTRSFYLKDGLQYREEYPQSIQNLLIEKCGSNLDKYYYLAPNDNFSDY